MRRRANEGIYKPPEGWTFSVKRHAYHDCGWSQVIPFSEPSVFLAAVEQHHASCSWPDPPEADTPEG